MRLTTKGRFAVTAMIDLALRQNSGPVTLAAISQRQQISLSYLEQLFARLRKGGLVRSVRGPGGGYRLAAPATATVISAIVQAVDEPLRATRCAQHNGGRGCMAKGERCLTHDLWDALSLQIEDYLSHISLADVLDGRLTPGPSAQNPGFDRTAAA